MIPLIITVFIYMNNGFLVSLLLKRNDVADIGWGLGFLTVALVFFFEDLATWRAAAALIAVALWAFRLAAHIYLRNRGQKEDWRYLEMRQKWGDSFLVRSYFQVWMLQGAIMVCLCWPIVLQMQHRQEGLSLFDVIGAVIFLTGLLCEAVADEQLRRFKMDSRNKGKLMVHGIWAYSRHPNYFGEAFLWWGFALACLHLPQGYTAVMSASLITFLLIKVSGVAMLEKGMENRPGFAEYRRQTSVFIPWFKRK